MRNIAVLICSFLMLAATSLRAEVLELSRETLRYEVPGQVMSIRVGDVPEDPADWRTLPDSAFRSLAPSGKWSGFRPGHVLLRIPVRTDRGGLWWVRPVYVDIDSLRAGTGVGTTCWIGEDVPRDRWCTPWHALWVPVVLRHGLDTVHIEIAEWTGRLGVAIRMEPDGIRQTVAEDHALRDGLFVGLLVANLLLALILFGLIRHRAHFWYVWYQAFVILFVFSTQHHSFAWLWPDGPDLNQITPSLGSIGAFGALSLFLCHMLDLHVRYPWAGGIQRALGFVLMGLAALQLFIPVAPWIVDLCYAGPQMEILEIASYALGIVLVLRAALEGNRLAAFAAVASLPMLAALGMSLGGELVHEPWLYSWRGVVVEIAMCLENTFFGILLVHKADLERRDRRHLLEKLLEMERDFNDRLVRETDQHLRGTALDLHDGIGQDLAALRIQAEILAETPSAGTMCSRFKQELSRVSDNVRATAHGLYPPELKGGDLNQALQLLRERLRDGEVVDLVIEGRVQGLSEEDALQWYRIAQEAVQNARKHGKAGRVRILVTPGRMEIEDDGVGFPETPADGVGLRTIRIRAAQLGCGVEVGSVPGGGCRVVVGPG